MKVEVSEGKLMEDIVYPCLMKSDNNERVVLMHKYGCGTVVVPLNGSSDLRQPYSEEWHMGIFEPFTGTIKLSN